MMWELMGIGLGTLTVLAFVAWLVYGTFDLARYCVRMYRWKQAKPEGWSYEHRETKPKEGTCAYTVELFWASVLICVATAAALLVAGWVGRTVLVWLDVIHIPR